MVKGKRGQNVVIAWAVAIVAVFVVTLLYIIFSQPMSYMVNYANTSLTSMQAAGASNTITNGYGNVVNLIQVVWNWWPVLLVIAAVVYVIAWAIRREVQNYYY